MSENLRAAIAAQDEALADANVAAANAAAAAAQLTPKLGNVSDLTPTPIVITVTVENAGSGASVEYTVNLSQAD